MREEGIERLSIPRLSYNDPWYLFYKTLLPALQAAVEQYAKGDVLDIGCGNKPYEPWFAGRIQGYVGCDIVQSDAAKVDILCPANAIPLPDNSKDTVFSTQVIEHVADHNGLLREAFRILRPGGVAIVSGPMYWEHHEEPYDFFRFTRYGFEHIFKEAGFTDIQLIPNGGKWALAGQMLQNNLRSSMTGTSFVRRFCKAVYWLFRIKWIFHALFGWLDHRDPDYSSTLNWIVVARKP